MQRDDDFDKKMLLAAIIGLLIALFATAGESQAPKRPDESELRARAIIARHDSASGRIGGRSSHRFSHMLVELGSPAMKATTETWTMVPNRVLTRTTMPGSGTVEIGYNGSVGWSNSPFTGPVLLEGEQLKQLAKQAEGRGPMEMSFKVLSAGARTSVEGRDVMPVIYEDDKGNAGTLYFDAKTGVLSAMRVGNSVKADSAMLLVFSDYKRIDGELFAMTTTAKGPGPTIVSRTTLVDHKPIDTAFFEPPSAVQALLKRP